MAKELNVFKETVSTLFRDQIRYEIPQYQRPYSWTEDQCSQLWSDVVDFLDTEIGQAKKYSDKLYYFGAVVTIDDSDHDREIVIDGQQRITSLLLLLRAFYRKLREFEKAGDKKTYSEQVSALRKCLWIHDPETGEYDESADVRLISKVDTAGKNKSLQHILATGELPSDDKSNCATNYRFFCNAIDDFSKTRPGFIRKLCTVILNNCVVFPILCREEGEALRIFKTLNDRGLDLSDSDIFKSRLYEEAKSAKAKKQFIEEWESLGEMLSASGLSIDNVFRYYSYYVIGLELKGAKTSQGKEDGLVGMARETDLRKFFADKKHLGRPGLMKDLLDLAQFWKMLGNVHNKKARLKDGLLTDKAARYLDCLNNYPNVNWRRVVSVYYFANNKNLAKIKKGLEPFLARLLSFLCVKYIAKPTVDSIRRGIADGCVELVCRGTADTVYTEKSSELVKSNLIEQLKAGNFNWRNKKFVKTLILLNAYLIDSKGKELVDPRFQIEHILPVKWKQDNYLGWSEEAAAVHLESLGNKMPLESLHNVHAGNKYFDVKKKFYKESSIKEALEFSKVKKSDWGVDDVILRCQDMSERLYQFFKKSLKA